MISKLSQMSVMTIEEGEELFAGLITEHIPQVGIYKLLAKKRVDGTIEWAHFVERDNGQKENVMRGTVDNPDEFDVVIDALNRNMSMFFDVTMQHATYNIRALDGKKASNTIH